MAYSHLLIYFTMYINNFFFHYIFKHVKHRANVDAAEDCDGRRAGAQDYVKAMAEKKVLL